MNLERWQAVEQLFHAAVELPRHERAAFLEDSCAADAALRSEVQALLDESEHTDSFLESSAFEAAAGLIDAKTHSPLLGKRLSEYELQEWLGAGGMGEVYRARDTRLNRDVAFKVLLSLVAGDPERVARFRREAQILAALNHPHIASIYALEESEGVVGLVLELVEGPTLADRLAEGPLPLHEALRIARQAADALEAAHDKGVVHRDLKPANVKITPTGSVKVLDFGLAKAVGDGASGDLTGIATVDATREGMVVGTASYMSPEQARGLPIDRRTDIWALGCVLYEMLAGRKAFAGATATDCLAAIIGAEPDWKALPASTPATVLDVLRRCLEKDVQRRLSGIADVRRGLDDAFESGSEGSIVRRWSAQRAAAYAAVAAGIVAVATGVIRFLPSMRAPVQTDISLPADEFVPPTHSSELAVSPDGNLIAYASMKSMQRMTKMDPGNSGAADMSGSMPSMSMTEQIYVRAVTSRENGKPIGGALGSGPFFSPDSKWLGFWHAPTGTLRKVALTGGAPVKICAAISGIAGAAWGADDTIVFAWFDLFRVPASGGTPKLLLKVDEQRGERFYRHPSFLPSGKAVVFTIGKADAYSYDDADIAVVSLDSGEKKILIEGGTSARYSPSGHLVYARGGKLLAVPFDEKKAEVTGQPFPVIDGVFMSSNTGAAAYSISLDGRLVYAAGPIETGARVPVWVDRTGHATPLQLPPRSYLHPRLSPDRRQMAIEVEGASHDLFVYEFARGVLTKMSFDGASHWPLWTPNGERLTFRSWKTGTMTLWSMPVDQGSPPELLTNIGSMQSPESWSPDGKALAFTQMDDPESGSDMYVLPLVGDRKPWPLVRTKFSEGSPKFSPDGKWIAYSSNESGRPEVYVTAYPGPGGKKQVSTDGGTDPLWRPNGGELYYRDGDVMMLVEVASGRTLTVSKPKVLWQGHYMAGLGSSCGMAGPTSANYDVTADGQRFLMIEDKSQATECKLLHVVRNWSADLKAHAASTN